MEGLWTPSNNFLQHIPNVQANWPNKIVVHFGYLDLVLEFEIWRCGMRNHGHVTTQVILDKFIEINFSVGCMVWP